VAESSGAAEAADKVQRARKGRIVDDGEQPEAAAAGSIAAIVRSYHVPYFTNKSGVWGAWGVDVTKNG
jgi:hypothetical protein